MPGLKEMFEGSRKFTIMALVLAVGVIFRIVGLVSGSEMVSLFNGVGIAFMGSNAVEHMGLSIKDWLASKAGGGSNG